MNDMEPEEYPFGESGKHNFDPEQVNSPSEAVEVLEWIADENERVDEEIPADVYRDAATMVRACLVEENDDTQAGDADE